VETRESTSYAAEGADLFERIRQASPAFTPSFRKVADYIVRNTHDVAFSPAARVAAAVGVSESVVVRFAAELGYSGYPALHEAAQAFVRSQIGPSARFARLPITKTSSSSEIYRSVLLEDIHNLEWTAEHAANAPAFASAVETLQEAGRIFITGFRGLRHLAGLLSFLLDMTGTETTLLNTGDVLAFQDARRMKKGDALVAFAFTRYTKATRELVQIARDREVATIVICDSIMAPAARIADHAIQTAVASQSFHNSYAAAVSCVNALVSALATRARARVVRSLREVDEVLPEGYFEGP
jgi:DNA-binding MurR/RpiR family transcriptional regulator